MQNIARQIVDSARGTVGNLVLQPTLSLDPDANRLGVQLLAEVPAAWRAVTFPLRTLGGRSIGMEKHYSDWMEANVPKGLTLHSRLIVDNELIYLFKEDC